MGKCSNNNLTNKKFTEYHYFRANFRTKMFLYQLSFSKWKTLLKILKISNSHSLDADGMEIETEYVFDRFRYVETLFSCCFIRQPSLKLSISNQMTIARATIRSWQKRKRRKEINTLTPKINNNIQVHVNTMKLKILRK